MQKSLSELTALPPGELSTLLDHLNEPLLVTHNGEPKFVAQSLTVFEAMVRRLRLLEQKNHTPGSATHFGGPKQTIASATNVIPIRR